MISLDSSMNDDTALALGNDDHVCLTFVDGPGSDPATYRRVVKDLIEMVDSASPVLAHCHAGRSRSVAVVAGFLVNVNGWTVQAAFDFIAGKRDIAVQDGLRELARSAESI